MRTKIRSRLAFAVVLLLMIVVSPGEATANNPGAIAGGLVLAWILYAMIAVIGAELLALPIYALHRRRSWLLGCLLLPVILVGAALLLVIPYHNQVIATATVLIAVLLGA